MNTEKRRLVTEAEKKVLLNFARTQTGKDATAGDRVVERDRGGLIIPTPEATKKVYKLFRVEERDGKLTVPVGGNISPKE